MRMFDVQGIEITATPRKVFEFVREPGNLPQWHAFMWADERRARLETPAGRQPRQITQVRYAVAAPAERHDIARGRQGQQVDLVLDDERRAASLSLPLDTLAALRIERGEERRAVGGRIGGTPGGGAAVGICSGVHVRLKAKLRV